MAAGKVRQEASIYSVAMSSYYCSQFFTHILEVLALGELELVSILVTCSEIKAFPYYVL